MRSNRSQTFGTDVPVLSMGTLGLPELDEGDANALVRAALDRGFTVFDTADRYGGGEAERRLGRALGAEGLVSTKVGMSRGASFAHGDLRASEIVRRVDESLARLGRDHVDLVYAHMPDPFTPIDETLEAFETVAASGRARAAGLSNFSAELVTEAVLRSSMRDATGPQALQLQYSILDRSAEGAALPTAQRFGLDVFTWGPLASGWLTPLTAGTGLPTVSEKRAQNRSDSFSASVPENADKARIATALHARSAEFGFTIAELAIAFAASHPAVTSVIVGPADVEQLDDCVRAATLDLGSELLDELDALVAPGSMVNPLDAAWRDPALLDASLRRR